MRFVVVAVVAVVLFGAPVLLESAALSEASNDVDATTQLTVGNGTYQSLGNSTLYPGSEAVESGNASLTRGEDYEIDYVNGSIAFTTCADQGEPAGTTGCPTEGESASVNYTYAELDDRGQPFAALFAEITGPLSWVALLAALVVVFGKAAK